ncbi:MAG: T9SS type A sorting domain-containing protein, partial [Flavobacteriales bacterium]|nr:T9SS type A sorting domain-containing protein [Flavobacteriales bacterium]
VIVASPTNWEGSLVSPLLDLSSTPYVEIEFQQRLRYCCQDAPNFLEVSTDGGVTWPTSFSTATGIDGNADPGTQVRKINLTAAIAADPTMVKVRFRHNAEAGTSHYHWQLDDIKIQELAPFDLRMTGSGNTAWDFNTALTYDSIRYSVFPYNQLRPLGLNMTVLNNGSETQDDVVANFTVMEGSNEILNQDQPVASFPPGETRTIFVDPGFTPPAVEGTYNVSYSITSGAVDPTADNTGSSSFQVSEFLYGRDGGTYAGFEDGNGDGGTLILGNAMYIANDAQLYSVAVALGNSSEIGALVVGELRNVDADFSVIATSQEVVVEQSMLNGTGGNKFTQLIFDNPQALSAGSDYLVTVQVFGNVRIGTNGTSEAQTSYIYYISPTQGENWFFTTTTPMVRMNFNPTVGIEDEDRNNGIGLGQNFPNPSTGTTTIPYELENAAKVSFQVRDLSGKLVMEQYEGSRAAGNYRVVLDTNTLPEGLYSYTIIADDVRMTKRMTVIH